MVAFRDLTGKRYGELTVLRRAPNNRHGKAMWVCRCACTGKEAPVIGSHLANGNTKSCGCLQRERTSERRSTFRPKHGERFNSLAIIEETTLSANGDRRFRCRCCECGEETVVRGYLLRSKRRPTTSCGCLGRERIRNAALGHTRNLTHGDARRNNIASEFVCWGDMIQRCHNSNSPSYKLYGANGIAVCERWRNSYEAFLADMGRKPTPQHSISRNVDMGNYEPGNCCWGTPKQQAEEQRKKRLLLRGNNLGAA